MKKLFPLKTIIITGAVLILLIIIICIGVVLPHIIDKDDLSIDEYTFLAEKDSFFAELKYISPDSAIGFSHYSYYIDDLVLHIKIYKGLSLMPIFPRYNSMEISITHKDLSFVKEIIFDCKDNLSIKIQL